MTSPVRIPTHAPDISEASLQRLILGRLVVLPGCAVLAPDGALQGDLRAHALFWRQNVVAAGANGRFVRAGVPGQPDIGGVVRGRAWGIECKGLRGRANATQVTYATRFVAAGGTYTLARSLAQALIPICHALGLSYQVDVAIE